MINKRKKYKKIFTDFLLNSIAMTMPIVFLQFVLYPMISKDVSNQLFGTILTVIALRNVLSLITGNSLNNVRLLRESEKLPDNNSRDYNLLLIFSQLINLACAIFLTITYYDTFHIWDFIFLLIIFILASIRTYSTVFYRLKLDYRKIIESSLVSVLGLGIGFSIYLFLFKSWTLIFLISEIMTLFYALWTTPILKEKSALSINFKKIRKDYIHLLTNATINNIMSYLDRFLINPLIGADQVAIYYVATIISKTFSLVFGPLNNVILSYTAKYKSRINTKLLLNYLIFTVFTTVLQFIIIQLFSDIIISFLYPKLYELSKEFITIASVGVLTGIAANTLQPLAMATCELKWQPRINLFYSVIYLILAVILTTTYGLYGFCYASIISHIVKFFMYLYLSYRGINK